MDEVTYTQIIFKTPQARVEYAEACLEVKAREVAKIYEGLRTDANDGTFALWSEDDLVHALHDMAEEITFLDDARKETDA